MRTNSTPILPKLAVVIGFLVLALPGPARAADDLVRTPFGLVHKDCLVQHSAGTTLKTIENGVRATAADGTVVDHITSDKCRQFMKSFVPRHPGDFSQSNPISNGWFNYTGWYPPRPIGEFTGTYTMPGLPSSPGYQNVYYFIGTQDNASTPLTILQPVIGYNQIGGSGWTLSSWNCCPSGQVHQGNVVSGMGPGDTISGSIKQISSSPSTYKIVGTWNGQDADLSVEVGQEVFNWADVTLEAYNVYDCDQFMNGPFVFSDLVVKDTSGNVMAPDWTLYPSPDGTTACNGKIAVSGSTVSIQENIPICSNVIAGPIWSNADAQTKCPATCSVVSEAWNGQWTTTKPGVESVCGCCTN